MPDQFVLEKIRTGEDDPYEVVSIDHAAQALMVDNFDDGTRTITDLRTDAVTVTEIPDASN